MSQAQFTIPLITVIPGQLITAALWNNEWTNVGTNLNPLGVGGYEDTDAQMQIQTAPYPGSVTSHASSLGGEVERIRFQISAILGATTPPYWYAAPPIDLTTLSNATLPIGGVFDYHSATPPSNNFLLANGQAIGRSAYTALNTLYSAASYPFGNGDGSTTFNLPNYTDKMSIGAGNLYGVAATGGAATHTLTNAELPAAPVTVSITDPGHNHTQNAHNHGITDPTHNHSYVDAADGYEVGYNGGFGSSRGQNSTTGGSSTGISISNATPTNNAASTGITASGVVGGSGTAHNILNPYISMYKLIRVL
jgi:microcystin-dependent protein